MAIQDALKELQDFDVNDIDFDNIGAWPIAIKIIAWSLILILVLAVVLGLGAGFGVLVLARWLFAPPRWPWGRGSVRRAIRRSGCR